MSGKIYRKRGSVLLLGSFGQTNLGDDLLMENFINLLGQLNAKEIIVNTNDPENIPSFLRAKVSTKSTYGASAFEWFKTMLSVDIIVYGGGTIYKELYSSTGRKRYSVISRIAIFNFLAKLLHKPVLHLNIGIGSIKTKLGRLLSRIGLMCCDYTVFRDGESFAYARDVLHISEKKIYSGVDALFLSEKWDVAKNGIDPKLGNIIGLNLLSDIPDWVDRANYIASLRDFVNYLLQHDYQIVFFPFQPAFNANNDTLFFQKEILPYLINHNYRIVQDITIENVIEKYFQVGLFVGMRFHSILLASVTATPLLAIDYDTKCKRFIDECGYAYVVKLEKVSRDRLIEQFIHLKNETTEAMLKEREMSRMLFNAAKPSMKKAEELIRKAMSDK